MFWVILMTLTCFKALLLPAYFSTDFEVHRNWLATTFSLPVCNWYSANHSQWTLDYPPFFAWFEKMLAQFAYYFDANMLQVQNLNYKSDNTILFQRLSVIAMDLIYAYGVKECGNYLSASNLRKSSKWRSHWNSPSSVMIILLLANVTLLLVDHVHFQYNGFLFGILLLSIVRMLEDCKLESAIWFAILLNFKHIFLYIAPAYFVYLLRTYCFTNNIVSRETVCVKNCLKLGGSVIAVFILSFGPFIWCGQLFQVLSRLFPFRRGLCHTYWAPNWWAIYNGFDKLLIVLARLFGFTIKHDIGSMTAGITDDFSHVVLPTILPIYTFVLSILAMLPCLYKLWKNPDNPLHFVRCIILCSFSAFLFGWHVHEKAILLSIIPLTLLCVLWRKEASIYLLLSTVGHYSVFPLLFEPFEMPIKILCSLIHSIYAFNNLSQLCNSGKRDNLSLPLLCRIETLYVLSLVPLFLYENVLHHLLKLDEKFPFLPLMLTSIHNSVGIIYCYISYYHYFLTLNETSHKKKAF